MIEKKIQCECIVQCENTHMVNQHQKKYPNTSAVSRPLTCKLLEVSWVICSTFLTGQTRFTVQHFPPFESSAYLAAKLACCEAKSKALAASSRVNRSLEKKKKIHKQQNDRHGWNSHLSRCFLTVTPQPCVCQLWRCLHTDNVMCLENWISGCLSLDGFDV